MPQLHYPVSPTAGWRSLLTGLALTSILMACSSSNAVETAEKDVFAVHDELMPKMDDLAKARRALQARLTSLDSVATTGSAAATLRRDEERDEVRRLLRNVSVADSLMLDWMGQYKSDTLATLPDEDALRYLDAQKVKITDVKTRLNASLEQSRQYLAKPY